MDSPVFFRINVDCGAVHTLQRSYLHLVRRCQLLGTISNICSAPWGLHSTPGMGLRGLFAFPSTFMLAMAGDPACEPATWSSVSRSWAQLKLLWSKNHKSPLNMILILFETLHYSSPLLHSFLALVWHDLSIPNSSMIWFTMAVFQVDFSSEA